MKERYALGSIVLHWAMVILILALIGLGFRNLSMTPSSIGPVKTMVRSLRLAPLEQFLPSLAKAPDHSVRGKLSAFARDHGVII